MDNFESFSEDITKWEVLRDIVDLDLNDEFNDDSIKYGPRVQLLPRKSINIYGNIPKMEQRIFSKCKECRLIFNPRNILSHKACMGRNHSSLSFDLKKKSKNKSSKKSHSNTPSPPPLKKPPSPSSPNTLSVISDLTKVISPKASKMSTSSTTSSPINSSTSPSHKSSSKVSSSTSHSKSHSSSKLSKLFNSTVLSNESTSIFKSSSSNSHSSSSSSSSSRHKKSRKSSSSNSKSNEEYNPSIHCGVIEDNKGPCTRSLSCSTHRSQSRKLVSSRSKEVHHLLNERKTPKEKDTKHSISKSHNFPNDLETKNTGEHYGPTTTKSSNSLNILLPKTSDTFLHQNSTTSNKQLLDITDLDITFSKTAEVLNNESDAGTVPVVYMPMSPVSVVSPAEYVKIGKNIIRLESPQSATSPPITTNQSVFLGIPNNINVKMYNSHPKPITLPSFGVKKIGGAILLSKQQLEMQRNNLLMAISSTVNISNSIESYRTLNNSNVLYKSNILKNKNSSKSNSCKRSMSEKINSTDSKQIKYSSNLNGFLIHSTISETADAPSSNMMNDKMTFLNMK